MMGTILRRDLATLDLSDIATGEPLPTLTPGEVLWAEFMEPMGISARALARDIDVPPNRITGIVNGQRTITAETAVMLALRFGTTAQFWTNLQAAHDLERAKDHKRASLQQQVAMLRAGQAQSATQERIERLERQITQLEAMSA